MKKELKIFMAIFLVLALGMHFKECINHPMEHIESLFTQGWFGLHPLVITLAVYLLFMIIRGIVRFLKR
ncbi:hypothetical protein [Sulfurovum sp. NBC37-1]|uniref:hypothetical protein n=1 Tax=Sulfurovum sp. (strain NBC37-1) TaxID=387093 RepID=UPI00015876B1|nr:hypothetical protein [Sulfurovum sp. NBC37-1]BAF70966.1 conserved hypothetical protein [Sulfurovum sp. NBC37-1]